MEIVFMEPREANIISYSKAFDAVAREKIYLARLEGFPMDETIAFMKNTIEKKIPFLLAVNRDSNEVVGWCDAQPKTERIGYLGLGLMKEYRGHGLGKRLVCGIFEKGRSFGYEQIDLEVRGSNKRALHLYQSLGFCEVGTIKNGLTLGTITDDVIQMTIKL
ncbi:GNAT family N-acetyltransferase [Anaerotignum sp. MB30-C6]|uniref:GNAT family N-acetyltransferase n=1 Tax=Anaerotignum sp. MB30-C6 TaxID=3070814 RepID=UPI0027DB77B7|nr:GNAT family N-acetyltransferase [Anaerotignum sp. MB30-C6]WMI81055.1 GNAT family N-acetyltransferase [Anaerotignum sp. MB30-C6]